MSAEKNLKLLHEYHEAWERGDVEAGIGFFAEGLIVHMGGRSAISGTYRGRSSFADGWIARVVDYTDTWAVGGENEVLVAGEEGVVLMVHETWTKGERRCDTARIGIYLMADGAITECWFSDMNQPDADEFFSSVEAPAVDGFEPVTP